MDRGEIRWSEQNLASDTRGIRSSRTMCTGVGHFAGLCEAERTPAQLANHCHPETRAQPSSSATTNKRVEAACWPGGRGRGLGMVLGSALRIALLGTAIGAGVGFATTRVMRNMLFGVSAVDPMTFAAVAVLLVAVTILASYVPARRAMKIDPMDALHCE